MANYVTVISDKKKWTAFWLCFFFGALGAHRFYVGKIGSGLFYLFTFGGFFFGVFFDLIAILLGNFRDGDGLRVKQ